MNQNLNHFNQKTNLEPENLNIAEVFSSNTAEIAVQVAQEYLKVVDPEHQDEKLEQALRTADNVYMFASELLPGAAIDSAILSTVLDEGIYSDDFQKLDLASMALAEYLTQNDAQQKPNQDEYVMSMINDINLIDQRVNEALDSSLETDSEFLNDELIWSLEAPNVPIDLMSELANMTNLEAFIVKSCQELAKLHDNDLVETNIISVIMKVESFYAPACEILGFDALAMEMRSACTQVRFRELGKDELVDSIKRQTSSIRRNQIKDVFNEISDEKEGSAYNYSANMSKLDALQETEPVALGEFAVEVNDKIYSGNWRVKSVGSILKKLDRYDDVEPGVDFKNYLMDVLGMTVIEKDEQAVADAFVTWVEKIDSSQNCKFQPAPSKEKSIIIQGDDRYINLVQTEFDQDFFDRNVQVIRKPNGYRVSKMTFVGPNNLPTEVQFMTKQDRKKGRIGESSHILYKQGTDEIDEAELSHYASLLRQVFERKAKMLEAKDNLNLNSGSKSRNMKLYKWLYSTIDRHLNSDE